MNKKEFLKAIEGLSKDELKDKARELAEEGLKLRIRHASNQLETSHRLKQTRRNYARVLTARNARKKEEVEA